MSSVPSSSGRRDSGGAALDPELVFLRRFAAPIVCVARVCMAWIFVAEGLEKISGFARVADYMQQHGVAPALLPLVILTELGGGLLILTGFWTRWAALALAGLCLLTALLFHLPAGEMIGVQKNVAMAGGFLLLATFGAGAWSLDGLRGRAE